MLPELEKLLVLQDRDKKIRQTRLELQHAPSERKDLETTLNTATAKLEEVRQKGREIEVERKKLEIDAQAKRDTIGKYKAQQFQTRKNEEYQALGNEIKRFEGEIQTIEDRELDLMQSYDDLKKIIATAEAEFNQTKNMVQTQFSDLDKKTVALDAQLKDLESGRAALASGVEEDLLERFERLFKNKGEAVVALEHGVCMGCHMKVTVQTVTRAKGDREIVHCEQCGRILYFSE